jgi:hypothetical protein
MKKQNVLYVLIGLVVLIGVYVYMVARPAATPETYTKAKATKPTAECLAENTALTVPANERSAIELAAVSYLVDVPAGTEVDVKITTYSASKVTGSDHYPAAYGNYNFVAAKQGDGWLVTDFKRCD